VDDADEMLARWARMRADELAQLAGPIESVATTDAQRLWRHVACLDPGSERARDGIARTAVVRVRRPIPETSGRADRFASQRDVETALAVLDGPVRVVSRSAVGPVAPAAMAPAPESERPPPPPVSAPPPAPSPALAAADAVLDEADELLRAARFEEALARLDEARRRLPRPPAAGAADRRARLEGLAATANVALGRDDEARERFGSALRADPSYRLDPGATSPKVLRAFDAARAAQGREEGAR
jgi:tetratricopeptide (TPR) repeat protein